MTKAKQIKVYAGTCRHAQMIPVSQIKAIDTDQNVSVEFAWLTLKAKRPVYDGLGDRQWHCGVVAERADVATLLFRAT